MWFKGGGGGGQLINFVMILLKVRWHDKANTQVIYTITIINKIVIMYISYRSGNLLICFSSLPASLHTLLPLYFINIVTLILTDFSISGFVKMFFNKQPPAQVPSNQVRLALYYFLNS